MNNQSLITEIPEFTEEHKQALDALHDLHTSKNPNLNRLRRCPSTGVYHFTAHGNTDFLTKKIAEEYYNRNRGNNKQAKEISEELKQEKERESQGENANVSNTLVFPRAINDVEKKLQMQDFLKNLLGNRISREITFSSITSTYFDYKTFDELIPFPDSHLTYARYGEYVLCWLTEETFLLTTQKQMLWTL